jgi:hypothetical protein
MNHAPTSQEAEQAERTEANDEIEVEIELNDQPANDIDDEAPTLRRPPVLDDIEGRWFGRDTVTSAAVLALGVATLVYAAVGSPPYPQRALASGTSAGALAAR